MRTQAGKKPSISHWLPGPARPWTPESVLSFDTETLEEPDGSDLVLRPRCWAAVWRLRHGIAPTLPERQTFAGEPMAALGELVDRVGRALGESWVFAHNLGFDLSVSALPFHLHQMGWALDACNLTGESTWWVFRTDAHRLVLSDSWSWLRSSLEDVAHDLRRRKVPLPANDADLAAWLRRCRRDADLLDDAMATILDWWDREGIGRFGITGAGCGWAAARRQIGPRAVVVGPEAHRTSFERRAILGGRREVYRVGTYAGAWSADYDFADCYPRIAAHLPLPIAADRRLRAGRFELSPTPVPGHDLICEATVTTDTPCVPAMVGDECYWPTGTFRTTLAGPELRYALSVAQAVDVGDGWSYRMGYNLAPWAAWNLALLHDLSTDTPAVVRRMAKGWGRSVIGRFASHTSKVSAQRPSTALGWSLQTGHNLTTGHPMDVLSLGGIEYTIDRDLEPSSSFPAVLAFVESYARVALAQMMATRHPGHLLACNTDGWLEHRAVRAAAYDVPNVPWPHSVVRKGCWREVNVLGPSHLITPVERRLAGIPRDARSPGPNAYSWHDWPSLRWQLERSALGTYRRPAHDAVMVGPYTRRWVLQTGETVPVTCRITADGSNAIEPWSLTTGRRNTDILAQVQHPPLAELVDGPPWPPVIFEGSYPRTPGRSPRVNPY